MQKLILLLSLLLFQSYLIAQSPGDSMMVGDELDIEQLLAQDPTYKNFPTPEGLLFQVA